MARHRDGVLWLDCKKKKTNAHDKRPTALSTRKRKKNSNSYFLVPKPKKKPGEEQLFDQEESYAAAATAVLSTEGGDDSSEDDDDEDDDLAAAAATAALFDATDSLDGQEEEVDLSDFDDDELFLDAAALGYELKDEADPDAEEDGEGDGGDDDDDAQLARAVSRALAAAASASSSLPSSSSRPEDEQQRGAPDVEAALSAFDSAIDSWDLGGRTGFGDFDDEGEEEDDISFLLDIEDDDDDDGDEDEDRSENGDSASSSSSFASPKPLCARCFSLVNYGKVKNAAAEAALPSFDLAAVVGRKLALTKFRRQIVLVVVDVADFDGSLPRAELRAMLPPLGEEDGRSSSRGGMTSSSSSSASAPVSLVFAVNKADTLPAAATASRVADWARRRARAAGLRRPDAVHVVSSTRGTGVRQLLADLHSRLGGRGDVWVVGSQNAGKSSLLNAMKAEVAKWKGNGEGAAAGGGRNNKKGGKKKDLENLDLGIKNPITAAPLPGTTLGVLRVRGLLPRGCKMLDTPGAPSQRSVIAALSGPAGTPSASATDAALLLLPRSRLRPRSFRASVGQSLLLGGLARVDVVEPPSGGGPTLYLTVWAAGPVGVHYGSTEAAARARASLVARGTLVPPTVISTSGDLEAEERRERVAAAAAEVASALEEAGGDESPEIAAASLRFDQALGLSSPLAPLDVPVQGDSWKRSSVDVAIAGLGWVSVALCGTARLRVWVPRGVAVTVREALVPDIARELGRPGFNGTPVKEVGGGNKGGGGGGGGGAKAKGGGKKKKKKSN